MAVSHVNSQADSEAAGTSCTVTKPTGTTTGDLLLAFFTSNDQNCTPPSGWTEISDVTIEVFRRQVFYKVAGGSEPASYTFSVAASAPLVCTVSAFRGIDTADPIDIDPVTASNTGLSEAVTTPSVSGGTAGRLLYMRSVRYPGSTVPTFTASSVTEISDAGIFSGGAVCYAGGIYIATADYSTSGSQSGLAITTSQTESHNITLTMGIKASGVPGVMGVNLPLLDQTMDGSIAYPAVVDVDLPQLSVDINVFYGAAEGTLDTVVPIGVEFAGNTPPLGQLAVLILPVFEAGGETRRFSDNVVSVAREERWMILTQDDMHPGVRHVVNTRMRIDLPLLEVAIEATPSAAPLTNLIDVTAYDAAVKVGPTATAATTSATAENVTALLGTLAQAQHVSVTCHN